MRRTTLSRRSVLALFGVLVAVLVLGCGGDDEDSDAGVEPEPASDSPTTGATGAAQDSAPGQATGSGEPAVDRLILAQTYTGQESNDPRDLSGTESWQLRPMYESLLSHDRETGEIVPGLADDWEISEDGLSVRFTLREGIQFHDDWGEMTAEDVVFSYDYQVADPERGASVRQRIDRVEAMGDYEVVVYFTQVDATNMLWVITDLYIWSSIMSKAHWEEMGDVVGTTTPPLAGTGPWKLTERESGSFLLFERVEDHWRKTPDFQELEVRIINENSTKLSALLAEEIHVLQLPRDLQEVAVERGMEIINANVPSLNVWLEFWCCALNMETGEYRHADSPLLDERVRKALNKAINREELNEAFYDGQAEIMAFGGQFHATNPGWDPAWEVGGERWEEEYGYDPEAATDLLEEAGYGPDNPLQLNMLASYQIAIPAGTDIQETIIGYWQAVGVETEFITMDRATERPLAEAFEFENHFWMGSSVSPPPISINGRINNLRDTDPEYTGTFRGVGFPGLAELFDQAVKEPSPDEYDALMREVGEVLFSGQGFVPLFWPPTIFVANPEVVADWSMPGNYGGILSHTEYLEAVTE